MFYRLLIVLALLVPTAARAEWREATSTHFIVYSDGSERRLREAVADLEKYDFLLRAMTGVGQDDRPPKLKIYLVRNSRAVADTMPRGGGGVAGYYTTGPRGAFAVATRSDTGGRHGLEAQDVLFHEYAHHFMFQYFPATYPSWYVEGFADYYGTAQILDNDVIEVGHGLPNRYLAFRANEWLPLDKLLTAKSYEDVRGRLHLLYAQGWMLVHYLMNNGERSGQLGAYLNAINDGRSYREAMDAAFGPGAEELDDELRDYSGRRRIMAIRLPFKPIDVGPIAVRTLRPAEEALIEHDIALQGGVMRRDLGDFAAELRSDASRFPDDPYTLSLLVETERLAGDLDAANEAIERWLAVSPGDAEALMHKGEVLTELLRRDQSANKAAWEEARALLIEANRLSPRDPRILVAYYRSFLTRGVMPPAGAQNALFRALELIPQDDDIRYMVAADFEARSMIDEAIAVIRPSAFALHDADEIDPEKAAEREERAEKYRLAGTSKRETAREMLVRLEGKLAAAEAAAAPTADE